MLITSTLLATKVILSKNDPKKKLTILFAMISLAFVVSFFNSIIVSSDIQGGTMFNHEQISDSTFFWSNPAGFSSFSLHLNNASDEVLKVHIRENNSTMNGSPIIVQPKSSRTINYNYAIDANYSLNFSSPSGFVARDSTVGDFSLTMK